MKHSPAICFVLLLTAAACKKNAGCDGIVFSKNHVPVPNIPVTIGYSEGGKEQIVGYYHLSTNSEGHFELNEKIPKKQTLEEINIVSDSGRFSGRPGSNMEIFLN